MLFVPCQIIISGHPSVEKKVMRLKKKKSNETKQWLVLLVKCLTSPFDEYNYLAKVIVDVYFS